MSYSELKRRCERWMVPCGPHDYGIDWTGCACPQGDPRVVVSELWQAYEKALTSNPRKTAPTWRLY